MQIDNTHEDFETVSIVAIYPWRPFKIRCYFTSQSQNSHLPFEANVLKNSRKYKFWSTRQHSEITRRNGIPLLHVDVHDHIHAANMKGLSLISVNSMMGTTARKAQNHLWCRDSLSSTRI